MQHPGKTFFIFISLSTGVAKKTVIALLWGDAITASVDQHDLLA
jgi:hypothetical protein